MDIFRISLSLAFLQIVSEALGKRHKFCDYRRNVFFDDVSGDCKKCNPCRIGWGLQDNIEFRINNLRGATGCRKCRPCADDTFQKRHNVYRKCKSCRRCSHLGEIEKDKCTERQNARCAKPDKNITGVFEPYIHNTRPITPTEKIIADGHLKASTRKFVVVEENDVYSNVLLGVVAVCTFIVTLIVTVVYLRICIRKHRKRQADQSSIERNDIFQKANKDETGDTKTDSTLVLLHKEANDEKI